AKRNGPGTSGRADTANKPVQCDGATPYGGGAARAAREQFAAWRGGGRIGPVWRLRDNRADVVRVRSRRVGAGHIPAELPGTGPGGRAPDAGVVGRASVPARCELGG